MSAIPTEEMKPCPFCGSRMIRVKTRKTTIVECAACPGLVIRKDRDDAISAWNRRAAPAVEDAITLRERVRGYLLGRDQAADFAESAGYQDLAASIRANWAPEHLPPECSRCNGVGERPVFDPGMGPDHGDGGVQSCPDCDGTGVTYPKDAPPAAAAHAIEDAQEADARRYRWLRERDLETIRHGGIFVGRTPENVVINGNDLDAAIDAALASPPP